MNTKSIRKSFKESIAKPTESIKKSFKASIAESVELFIRENNNYQIFLPFHFDDGDHFVVILKPDEWGRWIITDEGHTYMHMSYNMDLSSLKKGTRNEIIENSLEKYGVKEIEGQLIATIDEISNTGNILYHFIQCLISINNISYLSRERVISTFKEDFKSFVRESVSKDRVQFDYTEASKDPDGKYKVDCRVNGMSLPLHIYAIGNDDKCRDTTITILQHQKWNLDFFSLVIFKDKENINRKVSSRLTDVCDREFSSLVTNKERIKDFLSKRIDH